MPDTLSMLLVAMLAAPAAAPPAPTDAFTVLEREPDGPRITPYLTYQIEMAWKQEAERRAVFAGIKTEADLLRVTGYASDQAPRSDRWATGDKVHRSIRRRPAASR